MTVQRRMRVLSARSLPTRVPTQLGIVLWLLMDRLEAAGWVIGMVMTLWGLLWLGSLIAWLREMDGDPPGFGTKTEQPNQGA